MTSSDHASFRTPLVSSQLDVSSTSPTHGDLSFSTPTNFTVALRVRPPLPRELHGDAKYIDIVKLNVDEHEVAVIESPEAPPHRFTFDYVYPYDSSQELVYNNTAKAAVLSTLDGYNNTIFAYGQTGTGKTFTMEGWSESREFRGIIPRVVEEVFGYIENVVKKSGANIFTVRASYLQIYNEVVSDLLVPEQTHLQVREDKKKGVFVKDLSEWTVHSVQQVVNLIRKGTALRARASTRTNDESSRSHAVFTLIVEQEDKNQGQLKIGKLNLVDLAGSERLRVRGHGSLTRLKETTNINQSLSTLGNVIAALTENRQHIPYRDSKLTRILADSLGGNCKTTLIAMISPAQEAFLETFSTLKFAVRAKSIQNRPRVNEFLDEQTLLRQYELQLKSLRKDLEGRNALNVLDLEAERRQAEADKTTLLSNLEALSAEVLRERQDKAELEATANNIARTGDRIREMYQMRVAELESERAAAVEGQSKSKHLLAKQRVIMDQMTECLSERDSTILQLQQQLEASQRKRHEVEEAFLHLQQSARVREEAQADTIKELQKKVTHQAKEKAAVRMIFEQKLKRLVDGVATVALLDEALPSSTQLELMVLQRLVDASIAALNAS